MNALPSEAAALAPQRLRLPPDVRMQQILDAALVEFAERGFTATRMDDIARRSGLSKGGLYAHFASKDEIFEALLTRSLTPPDLHDMPPPGAATTRQLAAWLVDRLYANMARPEAIATLRLLIAESERVPHLVAHWHAGVVQPHLALLGEILGAGSAHRGGTPSVIVREPWLAVAPVVHAVVLHLILGGQQARGLQQYRQAHVDMLCELLGG
nr:helix-turn-helix domain-containing protein [uncultured Roseateles sp.]